MATLAQAKTTDGTDAFTKYVTKNPHLKIIDFRIENGMTSPVLIKKNNKYEIAKGVLLNPNTKFKIIDTKYTVIDNTKFAKINYNSITGYVPLKVIRKPTADTTIYEREVVDFFNKFIQKNGGGSISIEINNKIYYGISYAVRVDQSIKMIAGVKKDPKADIILCKDIADPLGKRNPGTSIFISYKKGIDASSFHQYGGVSPQAGTEIHNHKEVQNFLKETSTILDKIDTKRLSKHVVAELKDDDLKTMALFGYERKTNPNKFSLQNVQMIGQGIPTLQRKADDLYKLSFEKTFTDLNQITGGYKPLISANPTSDYSRGFTYDKKRYTNIRVGIYPKDYLRNRNITNL